jgi:hypothetical protein
VIICSTTRSSTWTRWGGADPRNHASLDRYEDGAGVRMMMVNVSPTVGGGEFTVSYVNQDGVTKTTPNHFCSAATNIATLTATTQNASGFMPFLSLAAGDSGVRSVNSVTFSVANGGLCSLVLVKPLRNIRIREANVATEVESLLTLRTCHGSTTALI